MKVSLFSLIFKDRSLEEIIKLAWETGFDGVELWGSEPHMPADTTKSRAKEIRSMLDEYGLELPAISTYIGKFSTASDNECKKAYEKLEKYLNMAGDLRCSLINVGCGGPNVFLAQEYHYKKALYWMEKCADLAEQYNCRIAMEICNGSLIETVEAADGFIKELNKDNIGFIHDAGNMYITDTDYGIKSVKVLGSKIFHVHVKDELRVEDDSLPGTFYDRTVYGYELFQQKLLGEGAVDHVPLIKALIKTGYKGFLSSECYAAVPDIEKARYEITQIREQVRIAEQSLAAEQDSEIIPYM